MPLSFLIPAFLFGLAAVAIPIAIHLTRKQRAKVEPFPSLMFLERVPYQAESRRKIHHWFLLLLRGLAIVLLVIAFARPFFDDADPASAVGSGPREVVVLLDRSYSMGLGDRWSRALDEARQVVTDLGPLDRASLVYFAHSAHAPVRSTADRLRLRNSLDTARVSSEATNYGPGLKLAQAILEDSELHAHELVVISDFQRAGWSGEEGVTLPPGTAVTPVALGGEPPENVALTDVTLARQSFSGRERVTPTARVTRVGGSEPTTLEAVLEIDGREVERASVELPANGAAHVTFAPITLDATHLRGTVRLPPDELAPDNEHHFVVSPGEATNVLLVGDASRGDTRSASSTLYLENALSISAEGDFQVRTCAGGPRPEELEGVQVVLLHDRPFPAGGAGTALVDWVAGGGGLVVALGERSTLIPDLAPGAIGPVVDRSTSGARLGTIAFDHPIFEVFAGPRSGDFTGPRFFRTRSLDAVDSDSVTVLARYDDGTVALAERRVGEGRVLVWTSTLDRFWNDLSLSPIFLPFVHQLASHASGRVAAVPWFLAGQVIDVTDARAMATAGLGDAAEALASEERVAFAPSGESIALPDGEGPHYLELHEQGFYEIRPPGAADVRPLAVAVNVDLAENDLVPLDVEEMVAAISARDAGTGVVGEAARAEALRREDQEKRQSIWRILLMTVFIVLILETAVSNRVSRHAGRKGAHARA